MPRLLLPFPLALTVAACAAAVSTPPRDAAPDTPAAPDVLPDVARSDAAPADVPPPPPADVPPPDVARDATFDLDPCGGLAMCGGVCRDTASDPRHCGRCDNACPATQECVRGACVMAPCIPPLVACEGACVDARSDPRHCGACGCICPIASACTQGQCVVGCPAGRIVCGRTACGGEDAGAGPRCVDPQTDTNHCGACGNACPPMQLCFQGICRAL